MQSHDGQYFCHHTTESGRGIIVGVQLVAFGGQSYWCEVIGNGRYFFHYLPLFFILRNRRRHYLSLFFILRNRGRRRHSQRMDFLMAADFFLPYLLHDYLSRF